MGVRQRLIILIFTGLFVTTGLIGTYRYFEEKRDIIETARIHGEESGRLLAELAAPSLLTENYGALRDLAQNFMHTPDAQEVTIVDSEGRLVAHAATTTLSPLRIVVKPLPISLDARRLGEIRLTVFPSDLESRLRSFAINAFVEDLLIFAILSGLFYFFVTRTVTAPVQEMGTALKAVIDRKDFTRRVAVKRGDEIGELANGVNYLIARLEQFIVEMGRISSRINELSPSIAADAREVRKNAGVETDAMTSVSSAVAEMSSSIQSIAESAESLTVSAEETSSSILEMNATNKEVALHTAELTSSVEDVTTSVTEMIASIREVAGHVENLTSAAEETSASAIQIEATVREVAQAAKESTKLSHQVSAEAKDIAARSIQETMNAINTIKDTVERYSGVVTRLGKRSEEIGKILGVIVEVTERTNLLALNASILAAQAGEHGRGFAVVAEEIKALADRTAGSAQDIGKLITAVQKEAKEAVAAMAASLTAVEEGVRRSREAASALDKMLASSTRSAEMAAMIDRAMSEQARGIQQVSQAVANVKQMMEQIASATQAQTKGTEMILTAAEGMRDIARRVRIAMTEQERGGAQIAEAAENVTHRAGKIAAGSREQRQAVQQVQGSLEQIQDLPRRNMKGVEGMAGALKILGEQAELLNQEISSMTVGKGQRDVSDGALLMGVIPLDAPAEMHRRFTPLADYLSRALGRRVELSLAVDFAQTLADLEEGATHLAYLTPTTYLEAHKKFGAVLLVKALRNGVPYTHSTIVARAGGGISSVEEIKGKRFAFGDKMSTSSYLMPRAMLADAGIGLGDLKDYVFLGHHDAVAEAVLAGEYDAGGLRESTAKLFEGRGLAVIKTSVEIPEFNICVSKTLDRPTADRIKQALQALDRRDADQARLLTMIDPDYTGFADATDSDYETIRTIVEKLEGAEPSTGSATH
ncbi:MAG: phosphate/phosphite/phosphonate ABC transporter substrate-binding protein [Nitrospiraceae bacterium]|nr:phosphate/phosphite/phosphonate ABC transporter substrate-binding protein [Nitrospiraceae bacterium]